MNNAGSSITSRRAFFAQGAGLSAAAMLATGTRLPGAEPKPAVASRPADTKGFPADFEWGVATAAIQIEGAASEDGRSPSIWDTFSRQPGRIANGDTPDIACDHYHRYADDIALMADLGVKHYRFSIAWPRVVPEGRGKVNEKAIDFYRRMVDTLLKHGITPHATLYHWDLPQVLQDRYRGWESREVAKDFGEYVSAVVSRLGDRIDRWIPLNEIMTFACYNGYTVKGPASHAPGITLASIRDQARVVHHTLLAHGTACQAIRAASPRKCRIGIAENFASSVPLMDTPEHIQAARRAFDASYVNGAVLFPLLEGKYDPAWLELHRDFVPDMADGDAAIMNQPIDELGFNCYTGEYVRAVDTAPGYESIPMSDAYPRGGAPWLKIIPEAIYWGVRFVSERQGDRRLPVFISENGCADTAQADAHGFTYDIDRVEYTKAYLRQLQRAVADGFPVSGYFHWSLMDNFEWSTGYTNRFGLVHVDFPTQRRTPKLSYRWYKTVIQERSVI